MQAMAKLTTPHNGSFVDTIVSMVVGCRVSSFRVFRDPVLHNNPTPEDRFPDELANRVCFQISEYRSHGTLTERLANAFGMKWLSKELQTNFASSETQIYQCVSYPRDDSGHFTRGYIISPKSVDDVRYLESKIQNILTKREAQVFNKLYTKYNFASLGKRISASLFSVAGLRLEALEEGSVVPCAECLYHPAFLMSGKSSLFYSYGEAVDVLKEVNSANSALLLQIVQPLTVRLRKGDVTLAQHRDHPFIVIEGLDGTGKTTLTDRLTRELGATKLHTPPEPLMPLRDRFCFQPDVVARAYYSVGNYLVAEDIAQALRHGPVVMDRFWHSTAAYAMANEVKGWGTAGLPPKGHWAYDWPEDLIRPSIVLYLYVSEDARNSRLQQREGENLRPEESELKKNSMFRDALDQAYRRMENPSMIYIDASGSRDEVLAAALEAIKGENCT